MSILNGTPDLRHHAKVAESENDIALTSQIRSDLDDIQQRLRPRELKFEQVSKFNPDGEGGPRRQNTTSGIVQQQEVGLWLFGTQQDMLPVPGKQKSFEHMSSQ